MIRAMAVVQVAVLAGMGTAVGVPTYWKLLQPNPEIKACAPPVVVDGKGAPKDRFKAGETMYTARNDMFVNKVAGQVQRAFIGDTGTIYTLPLIFPPKTTPSGMCSAATFATVLPSPMQPGVYTYSVNVIMRKNPLEPAVFVPFQPVRITVVE